MSQCPAAGSPVLAGILCHQSGGMGCLFRGGQLSFEAADLHTLSFWWLLRGLKDRRGKSSVKWCVIVCLPHLVGWNFPPGRENIRRNFCGNVTFALCHQMLQIKTCSFSYQSFLLRLKRTLWSLSSGPTQMESFTISNVFVIIGTGPFQSTSRVHLCM